MTNALPLIPSSKSKVEMCCFFFSLVLTKTWQQGVIYLGVRRGIFEAKPCHDTETTRALSGNSAGGGEAVQGETPFSYVQVKGPHTHALISRVQKPK